MGRSWIALGGRVDVVLREHHGCGLADVHGHGFSDDVHVVGKLVDVVCHDRVDDDNDVQPDTRGLHDGDRSVCRMRWLGGDSIDELVG